jgi:hypothetical protein
MGITREYVAIGRSSHWMPIGRLSDNDVTYVYGPQEEHLRLHPRLPSPFMLYPLMNVCQIEDKK